MEAAICAAMEDVGNHVPENTLIRVVEDHDNLTNHLGESSDDNNIVRTPSIADNSSHLAENDLRTYR